MEYNIRIHTVPCPKYGAKTRMGHSGNGTITVVIMYVPLVRLPAELLVEERYRLIPQYGTLSG